MKAREGSPSRAGKVADISTPIIVPRAASRRRTRVPGSEARRMACQASARNSIETHMSAKAASIQTGVAASREWTIEWTPSRCRASAARPTPATAPAPIAALRIVRSALRRVEPGSAGSMLGSLRGGG
jgi:hypothetical protein